MDEGNMELDVLESILDGSIKPRDLNISALKSITENFSEERIIGAGGFGTVYKGVLRNGVVAVKKIRNDQTIDEKLFKREVSSLLNVSHKNIVRFIGFCSHTVHKVVDYEGQYIYAENRDRILCFEYINNGSLEKYITDELRGLQWDTRYFIIKGICEGLQYLHMEKHILHMDLKPANILIDYIMVAKITDFGLSRMEENSQTNSTNRALSLGYAAPEYIVNGKMSVKSDVYSLGIIIIELVTGHRSISDSNNVLRRWRHRLHKSGKETPFRYEQIAKLIEIGLLCQETNPYKRPSINDIIRDLNELDSMEREISNSNESTVGQISAYSEDDMLGIEPLELHFPFELNNKISCSLELTNETNASIAFSIQTTIPLPYCIQPNKDIVAPRSKYSVIITLQPMDKAPHDKLTGDFIVRSTKVNDSLKSEDVTEDIFNNEEGKWIDEVNLTVTYEAEVPQVNVPLGSPIISDTRNLHGPQESNVPPTGAESKTSSSTSDELIQFDPPELQFPFLPNKKVMTSIKIVNLTDYIVGFNTYSRPTNAAWYHTEPPRGILLPQSTQKLMVTREEKEDALKDKQFNDKYFVWKSIVSEGVKDSDLNDCIADQESMELPIVLDKFCSSVPAELIQLDPAELCIPLLLNKTIWFRVNVVNITDFYVAFNAYYMERNAARCKESIEAGILPPRSTKNIVLGWVTTEKELEDMEPGGDYCLWNRVVTERVETGDIIGYMGEEESKQLPWLFNWASPCTANELIQFDPPGLSVPFLPNKPLVFSVNIMNSTDYSVGFARYHPETNVGVYYIQPAYGVIPPRSTQRLVVRRVPGKKEQDDMQCEDKFFLCTSLVGEGVEASDILKSIYLKGSKELPLVYKKASLCTSDELIQFDPPQLPFPFLPSKRVSMLRKFKIANVTDHIVGFNMWPHEDNSAWYKTEPHAGILLPQSTQTIKVRRTPKEKETEDMQCKDKIFVWNGIVTEGVEVSDVGKYWKNEDKELAIVLTKPGESSSN